MTAASRVVAERPTPAPRYVRGLESPNDVAVVGGKAHALGRAIRAGIHVPPGFVLSTQALDDHLDVNGLRMRVDELSAAFDAGDRAAAATLSAKIRELVTDAPLSSELRTELFAAAETLLACGAVVVRSSAVGEDSGEQSFAGQLDSILHVTTLSALERAVLDCWSSYWSERALSYGSAKGVSARGMGVVVQQQVDARFAGVLFSEAGDGTMLVEYTTGLADTLVAGAIDPWRLSIDRETGAVRQLVEPDAVGLQLNAVTALSRTACALESEFGGPQDVEWAIDVKGVLWIVQSRPITAAVVAPEFRRATAEVPRFARDDQLGSTLDPRPSTLDPLRAKRVWWSNANVNENFPRPISPLLYSIAAPGYSNYFRNLARAFGISKDRIRAMEPAFRQIIGVHRARMYYNLTSIHSVLRLAPFGKALAASFDTFVGADGAGVEVETLDQRGALRQASEVAAIVVKTAWQYRSIERRIVRFEDAVDRFAARTTPNQLSSMTGTELRDTLRDFTDIRLNRWLDASLADAASMVCYGALQRLLENAYGKGSSVHASLLKAIPGVISGDPVHRLWELSRMIRRDESLKALFEQQPGIVLEQLASDSRFADFSAAFSRYLDDWGFRCSEELMLTSPSFQENPTPLVDMLRSYARLDEGSPADALREQEADRVAETKRVLAEVGDNSLWNGVPGLTVGRALGLLLKWTHAAIRFRERARMKQALLYSRCRRIALAIGNQLVQRGILAVRDDVFFLTVTEIDELLSGGAMLPNGIREIVAVRKRAHERLAALPVPDAFTLAEGEYLGADDIDPPARPTASQRSLTGTSACGGRVTGRAAVLRDVTEAARLERGDILVTRQTDPGWGPVFFLISGLVIERGGMLSHGAIIAREFGLPCVVGVRDATQAIHDGARITVDGNEGKVYVDP